MESRSRFGLEGSELRNTEDKESCGDWFPDILSQDKVSQGHLALIIVCGNAHSQLCTVIFGMARSVKGYVTIVKSDLQR